MTTYQKTSAQRAVASAHRGMAREERRRLRDAMTQADVEAAMRKIVGDKLDRDGDEATITLDDFYRANLPMQLVTPAARRIVNAVLDERRAAT